MTSILARYVALAMLATPLLLTIGNAQVFAYSDERQLDRHDMSTTCGLAIYIAYKDFNDEDGLKEYLDRMEGGLNTKTYCRVYEDLIVIDFPIIPEPHSGGYMKYHISRKSFEVISKIRVR